jgi:hypothetical protein
MTPISRGFGGRRRDDVDPSRLPPGHYYERGFQVLSAGRRRGGQGGRARAPARRRPSIPAGRISTANALVIADEAAAGGAAR